MMGSNEEGNCLACDTPLINKSTWGYCDTCWNDRKIMKAVEWETVCTDSFTEQTTEHQKNAKTHQNYFMARILAVKLLYRYLNLHCRDLKIYERV